MLSDTLSDGLSRYGIGPKIKTLRTDRGLGLVQLGAHTGLSAAMLSKIERGQLFPTLPTLLRIALVFGVGLEHFFVENQKRRMLAVVRKAERLRLPDRPGAGPPSYVFESLDFPATNRRMGAYLAEFPPRAAASQPHAHEGAEFIYCLSGAVLIEVDGTRVTLAEGDALTFDSAAPHSYRCASPEAATALVVVSPAAAAVESATP